MKQLKIKRIFLIKFLENNCLKRHSSEELEFTVIILKYSTHKNSSINNKMNILVYRSEHVNLINCGIQWLHKHLKYL